jgi:hypothetical protein
VRAALALGATAVALLLVAGGFVPAITAAAAAAAALPVRAVPGAAPRLARAWPWALAAFLAWGLGGWWLGAVANDALLRLGGTTFLLDLALPLAVAVTARAQSHRPAASMARR